MSAHTGFGPQSCAQHSMPVPVAVTLISGRNVWFLVPGCVEEEPDVGVVLHVPLSSDHSDPTQPLPWVMAELQHRAFPNWGCVGGTGEGEHRQRGSHCLSAWHEVVHGLETWGQGTAVNHTDTAHPSPRLWDSGVTHLVHRPARKEEWRKHVCPRGAVGSEIPSQRGHFPPAWVSP